MARIMLVGASPELADRLKRTLGSARIRLEAVGWADWAGRDVRRQRVDAALLDMTAPGAPGLQQIAERHARHRWLRLIFLVGGDLVRSEELQRLFQSPMVDFVRAPVDADEVWQRVRRLAAAGGTPAKSRPDGVVTGRRMRLGGRRADPQSAQWPPGGAQRPPDEGGGEAAARFSADFAFRHLVPEMHDPESGRLDAKRIAALFGMKLADIARLLGRELSAVHKTPDAPSLQPGLALFERIAAPLLYLAGSPENLRIWLNAPNPDLEDEAPLALLKSGEGEVVAELLEDALVGQPG